MSALAWERHNLHGRRYEGIEFSEYQERNEQVCGVRDCVTSSLVKGAVKGDDRVLHSSELLRLIILVDAAFLQHSLRRLLLCESAVYLEAVPERESQSRS